MHVIALDPGKLTGWAWADIDPAGGAWANLHHGILSAKDVVLELAARQLDGPPAYGVIVYEDWILYAGHAAEYIGSDMPYSQQIGQYRLIAWLSDTFIVKQGAARKGLALKQARAFRPSLAEKIESIAARQHKDGHDGDALLHLWAWTVDNTENLEKLP